MTPGILTKSRFLNGRHCPKRLYLDAFTPQLAAPPTPVEVARMETGQEIGALGRRLFPGGFLVDVPPSDLEAAHAETARLIAAGETTLFEAAFLAEGLFARCDVLRQTPEGWEVIEVKSSTKVKPEHLEDLAFQGAVLERCGLSVARFTVCRVDSSVSLDAGQPLESLLTLEDATAGVQAARVEVEEAVKTFLKLLEADEPPAVATNTHCSSPVKCPFYDFCHLGQIEHDLVFLPGIRRDAVIRFRESGVASITDVPVDAKLTPHQERAVSVVRFSQPYVGDGLVRELQSIRFPAHFVDFEASGAALPFVPGTRPYEPIPFQWSSHVLHRPDDEPLHSEFLATAPGDPREAFTASLLEHLVGAGSVVFYSQYELTRVKDLAEKDFAGADRLVQKFTSLGHDLLQTVREHVYFAEFRGSFSIKAVLPAVANDLSYADLAIKDGDTAALEYRRMVSGRLTPEAREQIAHNLRAYCCRDTLAMVAVYRELWRLALSR